MLTPVLKSCLDTVEEAIEANRNEEARLDSIRDEAGEVVIDTNLALSKNTREYHALADTRSALVELDKVK